MSIAAGSATDENGASVLRACVMARVASGAEVGDHAELLAQMEHG